MENDPNLKPKPKNRILWLVLGLAVLAWGLIYYSTTIERPVKKSPPEVKSVDLRLTPPPPQLDFAAYDKKLLEIANLPTTASTTASSAKPSLSLPAGGFSGWPVKTVYPNAGAVLPFSRIVGYYGNLYSKNMGVLGEYPEDEMLKRLAAEAKKWETSDLTTPIVPALHYIAVVAQAGAGKDGKYKARMPDAQIDRVLKMAEKISAFRHRSGICHAQWSAARHSNWHA
ncbi:MAG: hypothetical protein HYZ51_02295 [Candidatus Doudnabacteria bacterium]|nr:hypothetical protein [Candidatus Doudnabacteria bacterium]